MLELVEAVMMGVILILPLANPLTTAILLLSMSGGMTRSEINKTALLTSVYVFIIIVGAFYGGHFVMKTFGVSIPGLRIAGGLIVAFIGFRMLFTKVDRETAENNGGAVGGGSNIALVPLAMPSTAGPGTIAMVITSAASVNSGAVKLAPWILYSASILSPLCIAVILWLCLRSAAGIKRMIGQSGIDAISRIMGFLLVCMGVQFGINGVKELILAFPNI